jgi:hypothetical protein
MQILPPRRAMSTGEYGCYSSQSYDDIPADSSKIFSHKPVMVVPLVIRMDMLIAVKASGFVWGIARSVGSMLKWIPIKRGVCRSQGRKYSEIYWLRYSAMSRAAHLITQIPGNGRHAPSPQFPTTRHPNRPSQYSGKTPALYLRGTGFKSPTRKQATLWTKRLIKVKKFKLG